MRYFEGTTENRGSQGQASRFGVMPALTKKDINLGLGNIPGTQESGKRASFAFCAQRASETGSFCCFGEDR